jgi:hypothetical protein
MNFNLTALDRLATFRSKLKPRDVELLAKFELVLAFRELEVRSRNIDDQFYMLRARFRMQKIATKHLGVEIVMYDSVYGERDQNGKSRVGVFLTD